MLAYLLEFRRRSLYAAGVFGCFLLCFFFFANRLVLTLLAPLIHQLPAAQTILAINLTTPLVTPLTLALDAALLCSLPFALLQAWLFIAPALYPQEKNQVKHGIWLSMLLFILGVGLGYGIVLPLIFSFIIQAVPAGIQLMPDMASATSFSLRMLWVCGLLFQVPLVCSTCVTMGWVSLATLRQARSYVVVGAFILGMLLTPPDVLSQILLAVPLCLLYELGIVASAYRLRSKKTSKATKPISPTPRSPMVRKL